MEFQVSFQCDVKESKNALNTVAVVTEKLTKAEITFGVNNIGIPGIWAKFEGEEKDTFIAVHRHALSIEMGWHSEDYEQWHTAYARRRFKGGEDKIICEYCTDAAKKLVDQWVMALCDQYQAQLDADEYVPFSAAQPTH